MKSLLFTVLIVGLVSAAYATNTYAQAVAYAHANPTNHGSSWAGWCAAFVFRAGNLPDSSARESAHLAYLASRIASRDWNAAPPGAFHWWNIPGITDGHVALASDRQGWAIMASNKVLESWGNAMGITSLSDYTSRTASQYLGWSYDYAGAELVGVRGNHPVGGGGGGVPLTSTAEDGVPGTIYNKRMQLSASRHGYSGPLDGVLGANSWMGVQRGLAIIGGYTGPVDGGPGPNLYKAMQRVAQKYGYNGPIDGAMGPNSYRGWAKYLNTL